MTTYRVNHYLFAKKLFKLVPGEWEQVAETNLCDDNNPVEEAISSLGLVKWFTTEGEYKDMRGIKACRLEDPHTYTFYSDGRERGE